MQTLKNSNGVKKFLVIVLLLGLGGLILYPQREAIETKLKPTFEIATDFALDVLYTILPAPKPCTQPIAYTLGSFDTRFGLSREYFLKALSEAEAIWEKPFGKDLFAYKIDSRAMKINLLYDYRQEATGKLQNIDVGIKDSKSSYDLLKQKYTMMKTEFNQAKSSFESQLVVFNSKSADYEKQVNYWNSRGGAPSGEWKQLEVIRTSLNAESTQLQKKQTALNSMVDDIGKVVAELNRMAKVLNIAVDEYNTVSVSRGEEFEEGLYRSNGREKAIDIYEFSSRDKLVRILAHELGHSLGMDHVDGSKSIMYAYNQGVNFVPTDADMAELDLVCGAK